MDFYKSNPVYCDVLVNTNQEEDGAFYLEWPNGSPAQGIEANGY